MKEQVLLGEGVIVERSESPVRLQDLPAVRAELELCEQPPRCLGTWEALDNQRLFGE